jgi:uncharacterized protein
VPRLIQTGLWRWIKRTGLERFELLQMAHEWILRSTIVALAEHGPAEARYEVVCDDSWHTRCADIPLRDGRGERILRVVVEKGQWYENGRTANMATGCVNIDLEWSPSTNLIPIRRLRLAVGERSGLLTAAWVRFPDLALQSLPQEYERTSERCYRYISGGGTFSAEIAVDEEGLALNYEGFWQRAVAKLDV